jgi:hypothetical protein
VGEPPGPHARPIGMRLRVAMFLAAGVVLTALAPGSGAHAATPAPSPPAVRYGSAPAFRPGFGPRPGVSLMPMSVSPVPGRHNGPAIGPAGSVSRAGPPVLVIVAAGGTVAGAALVLLGLARWRRTRPSR